MHKDAIVDEEVVQRAKEAGVDEIGDAEYADLMQNIEFAVQDALEEEGIIERDL